MPVSYMHLTIYSTHIYSSGCPPTLRREGPRIARLEGEG